MTKLTELRRQVLRAMPDWSAPYEIKERLGPSFIPPVGGVETILRNMTKAGLCEHGKSQNTYRITVSGIAALKEMGYD